MIKRWIMNRTSSAKLFPETTEESYIEASAESEKGIGQSQEEETTGALLMPQKLEEDICEEAKFIAYKGKGRAMLYRAVAEAGISAFPFEIEEALLLLMGEVKRRTLEADNSQDPSTSETPEELGEVTADVESAEAGKEYEIMFTEAPLGITLGIKQTATGQDFVVAKINNDLFLDKISIGDNVIATNGLLPPDQLIGLVQRGEFPVRATFRRKIQKITGNNDQVDVTNEAEEGKGSLGGAANVEENAPIPTEGSTPSSEETEPVENIKSRSASLAQIKIEFHQFRRLLAILALNDKHLERNFRIEFCRDHVGARIEGAEYGSIPLGMASSFCERVIAEPVASFESELQAVMIFFEGEDEVYFHDVMDFVLFKHDPGASLEMAKLFQSRASLLRHEIGPLILRLVFFVVVFVAYFLFFFFQLAYL